MAHVSRESSATVQGLALRVEAWSKTEIEWVLPGCVSKPRTAVNLSSEPWGRGLSLRPYYLVHLVPSDQSIDLSGRMMPSELKVPPAAMVLSLVRLASDMAPLVPLICSFLPDWVIEAVAPDQRHGLGLGLH